MNICINIHNNPRNVHKNEKSSRHLDKKWYHGTIQSQMNIGKYSSNARIRKNIWQYLFGEATSIRKK